MTVILLLACKIRYIQCKFPWHQTILRCKIKHHKFKLSQLLQKHVPVFIALERLKQKQHIIDLIIIIMLLQRAELPVAVPILGINIQKHQKKQRRILMPHINLSDLIHNPAQMASSAAHQRRQIQIISIADRVFSDSEPAVVIVLQNPFGILNPPAPQINMGLKQLQKLVHRSILAHFLCLFHRTVHPLGKLHTPAHIRNIFFYNLRHHKFNLTALLIDAHILNYFHIIGKYFIRRHQKHLAEIPPRMQPVRIHQKIYLINISHKIIRRKTAPSNRQKFSFRAHLNGHVAPSILDNRHHSLGDLFDILKKHSLPRKGQEYTLLLFDPYEKLFHGLFPKRPLSHIVIQIKSSWILVFQHLIKLPGTKQLLSLRKIPDCKLSKIIRILNLAITCHHVWFLNNRSKRQPVLSSGTDNRKITLFHMSRKQSPAVILKVHSDRIPLKSLFNAAHTKRRRIYKAPDGTLSPVFNCKISPVYLSFTDCKN